MLPFKLHLGIDSGKQKNAEWETIFEMPQKKLQLQTE